MEYEQNHGVFKWVMMEVCLFLSLTVTIHGQVSTAPTQTSATSGDEVSLVGEDFKVSIWTDTLKITAYKPGEGEFAISLGQDGLGQVEWIQRTGNSVRWKLPDKDVEILAGLDDSELSIQILSGGEGYFTWPVWEQTSDTKALVWPRAEGVYIPLDDVQWREYLLDHGRWNTLEGLCMPFWGVDYEEFCVTYIATNPCNNNIMFGEKDGRLGFKLVHEFTRFTGGTKYGVVVRINENRSPVEPARQYRQWLIDNGQFVSMKKKIKDVPKAQRLAGAMHVYLWGDEPFTRHDIPRAKWGQFCKRLIKLAQSDKDSPAKRIKELMDAERWKELVELAEAQWPSNYLKSQVANEISRLLKMRDFYDADSWNDFKLPPEANELMKKNRDGLSSSEICRLNSLVFYTAFPDYVLPVNQWGNGLSLKMLDRFKDNGFDRVRLCLSGWEGVELRPWIATTADEMGYLFGTYDSFHSIHDPKLAGTDGTWATAQFNRELYEKGAILRKDGSKYRGFKGVGFKLSPIAAHSYVKQRIKRNMATVPYNYYFVDCDAYGEVYDDYSPLHQAGQADDIKARIERMGWIRDTFSAVIGSEGGSAYSTSVIHVSEGIVSPIFGWGDPDRKDRNSKYYWGGYYPPDGPAIFVKQVPIKEKYQNLYYNPRFRIPLYQTVFHDSLVCTHHWQNGSLKFIDVIDTVTLLEMLYMTPPMYHMNLDEFEKHLEAVKKHYEFFSPLHRQVGFSQMTDFQWLDPDRLLQRTRFRGDVEIVANFSTGVREYGQTKIPPKSVSARLLRTGQMNIFTCD
jgi:hypothetical protein